MTSTKRTSRRDALALIPGAWLGLRTALKAAIPRPVVRLAISESLVTDVNLNDARAAMTIWLKRIMVDLNITIDFSPKVFDTTEEIVRRARIGDFDCVSLDVIEYRQIAEFLDASQVISPEGTAGMDRYLLLAKRDTGIQRLADLKGRTLLILKHPQMCIAGDWLNSILEEGHFSPSDQFFGSITEDIRAERVVLPVFFGRTGACLTTGRSFDTMCELNPQVGKTLTPIAISPAMVVDLYVFRKNYHGHGRDAFLKVYGNVSGSVSGRQMAALFQIGNLVVRDASCLAPALAILDKVRGRGRKG